VYENPGGGGPVPLPPAAAAHASELRLAVLNFSRIFSLSCFNLFLIYNSKHCYASLFYKLWSFCLRWRSWKLAVVRG